jgi:hypothetical protein
MTFRGCLTDLTVDFRENRSELVASGGKSPAAEPQFEMALSLNMTCF